MTKIQKSRQGPGPLDIEIGKRIRLRRLLLGMTQRTLAGALGVASQQVQKYETGVNRVGAARLAAMADALEVQISYFIGDGIAPTSRRVPSDLLDQPDTLRLIRLYNAIHDESVRRQVLAIVEAVAEVSAPPSEVLEQDDKGRAG